MVDEELKEKLMGKIDDGSFGVGDLEEYMKLMTQVANESDDVKEEIEGWDRSFLFHLIGSDNFFLTIKENALSAGKGDLDTPDVTLECSGDTAAGIFTGEIDATSAYMSGDLKITGPLPDAVKFRTIVELVREELD